MSDSKPFLDDHRFFTAAIALAVTVWPIGFALGAYGVVFYSTLFLIWAVSLTALLAAMVLGRRRGSAFVGRGDTMILMLPTVWLISEILLIHQPGIAARVVRAILTLTVGLISVPHIVRIMILVSMPDAANIRSRRLTLYLFGVTGIIALAAFFFGYFNNIFISCDDFSIAGDFAPPDCSKTAHSIW